MQWLQIHFTLTKRVGNVTCVRLTRMEMSIKSDKIK